jgi:predicted ATPase/DNA-binding CsgD family transcriptional regulator
MGTSAGPTLPSSARPGNLPESVTSFIGRRGVLAAAKSRMAESRLVTLIGVGGVGKTRLALRLAADSRKAFRDGVWMVDLAPVGDGARLAQVVLSALRVRDQSARNTVDKLTDHLRDRQALIVLDNCEHLLESSAVLADAMLRAAPGLRIVATSREPLGIDGEHLLTVPPLSAPQADRPRPAETLAQYEAVHLLIDRARGVRPDFAVTPENHHAVAQLCAWLDGIPLAIELAATRLRSLSVAEVVDRLDDRFGFLTGGNRAAQPRQQTLRALIGWSHELCSAEEQLLWARLSVFAGSFDLAAVEGVCAGPDLRAASIVDLLDHLVAKSIVLAEREGERVRYRMLMTVREFGAELLAEADGQDALRRRHRDHYLARAETMAAGWCGPGQAAALAEMRADHANLCAALQWSLERPAENRTAAAFAAALRYHWVAGGSLSEGRRWLDQVLDTVTEPCADRVEALWVASWVCLVQGDGTAAAERLAECTALADSLGDEQLVAHAAHWSGLARLFSGDLADSVPLFEGAVAVFERAGNTSAMLTAQFQFAVSLAYHGEPARAREICAHATREADRHGERWALAYVRWVTGIIEWHEGELDRAEVMARQALTSQRDFHDGICSALTTELLAWIASRRADHRRSAQLFGAARAVWSEIGTAMHSFGPHLGTDSVTSVERAESALGADRFAALLAEGGAVDLPGAIEFALRVAGSATGARNGAHNGARNGTGAGDGPAGAPASPLSRREREVAGLIAQGLSNRAIAEALVISPRTVDGHVERILAKLCFASRAQVAAWVAEHPC